MKKLILLFSLIFAATMVVNLTGESDDKTKTDATVGDQAPSFEVMGADGAIYNLSDFEGQYVILEWLNHGCPYIQKHYNGNNMQQLQEKYTDQGVVWLSVISSAPGTQGYMEAEEARQSIEEQGASPTTILLDPEGEMGRAYDARVTPHMFIIDPSGTVRYNGAIDDKPTPAASSLETAHNYIDAAMNSLLNGEEVETKSTTPYGCSVKYGA
ncbi:thioredoxin family protein [Rhodohalobacter sulfatireducens]|uniref:Thioredoxin family protein n=1 Tax=Rhodohalobacter sulfatireducens TaxID=2911366 RepID=A0ABS9KBE2_9BACT|nr:thioredoxin family protein [Rhodohalobacter sulfatireducens]MCG2588176.1 thioredoxin family protein [Rhodohalobacter sulfatireducens]